MDSENMFDYYRQQSVLPTYGRFQSMADLTAHEISRRALFTDKLYLPPRVFNGGKLIEFGPDAGENSLVFALWGAECTLVEPNPKAHPVIKEYFHRFNLEDRLVSLTFSDVKTLAEDHNVSAGTFDFIVAEGFIYTVKPESLWIEFFSRLIAQDGFIILFYEETYGSLMEILLKVIHSNLVRLTGQGSLDVAQRTFGAKWDSISHKRSMHSWVMDVLENPFVRLRYFLDPHTLCEQMSGAGLKLYSSWPPYKDGLTVDWFKKTPPLVDELRSIQQFLSRNRLSDVFGRKHYLSKENADADRVLRELVHGFDSLVDGIDQSIIARCQVLLSFLADLIKSNVVVSEDSDRDSTAQTIVSVQHILDLLSKGLTQELVAFCSRDRAFIQTWGTPAHFAVFRKA